MTKKHTLTTRAANKTATSGACSRESEILNK